MDLTNVNSGFVNGDPVDCAIQWAAGEFPIPVIMPANEKRPGGDWEAGLLLAIFLTPNF